MEHYTAGWSALIKETTSVLRTGSRVLDFACVSMKALAKAVDIQAEPWGKEVRD